MQLKTIDAGPFKLDGGAMFGVVPKTIWQRTNPADDRNLCEWALRCLLIEAGNRLMLVDTGTGDKQNDRFFAFYDLPNGKTLTGEIERAGYAASDITDVLLTHLHFDHAGGAVRYTDTDRTVLAPTFANATYWVHGEQWNWAMTPNARERATYLRENLLPLQESGQLAFTNERDHGLGGLDLLYVDGHTEKMTLPKIQYAGRTLLFCADLIPSASHVPIPYVMGYDIRPLVAMSEKEHYLEQAVDGDWILVFDHDPYVEAAVLERTEKGIRVKQSGRLAELL
jgi:glyoxylase-like metal-dependent hydrolase (beta-lactamase superfamily II)